MSIDIAHTWADHDTLKHQLCHYFFVDNEICTRCDKFDSIKEEKERLDKENAEMKSRIKIMEENFGEKQKQQETELTEEFEKEKQKILEKNRELEDKLKKQKSQVSKIAGIGQTPLLWRNLIIIHLKYFSNSDLLKTLG